jgi:hypothetical protein
MNAEPAQMVPLPAGPEAAYWEGTVFGGLWPPDGIWRRMPAFFYHLDAILPRVGLESVICNALGG